MNGRKLGDQLFRMFTFRSPYGNDMYQVSDGKNDYLYLGDASSPAEAISLAKKKYQGCKPTRYRRNTGIFWLPWMQVK